jgi:hypothetical protein
VIFSSCFERGTSLAFTTHPPPEEELLYAEELLFECRKAGTCLVVFIFWILLSL